MGKTKSSAKAINIKLLKDSEQAKNLRLLKTYYEKELQQSFSEKSTLVKAIHDTQKYATNVNWDIINQTQIAYYNIPKHIDLFADTLENDAEKTLDSFEIIKKEIEKYYTGNQNKAIINYVLKRIIQKFQNSSDDILFKDWVPDWLRYCSKNEINPWEFDFKQSYKVTKVESQSSHLNLEFNYMKAKLTDINQHFNITNKTGGAADCDKEAFPIYKELGWQNNINDDIRGETINSFKTPYKAMEKIKESALENDEDFDLFACLTHSIGNFIVLPSWINQGRGVGTTKDYWDLTLNDLHKFHMLYSQENTSWKAFIEKFYLQPYVVEDEGTYKPQPLWNNHFSGAVNPEKIVDFKQFYSNVNLLIKERGKWITKILCEQLRLTDLNFYIDNHLDQMEKIRFFNEIITT